MNTITQLPHPQACSGSSYDFSANRAKDMQMKKQIEMSIEETTKTKSRLEHMLNEVNERLGLNKPDGPEVA